MSVEQTSYEGILSDFYNTISPNQLQDIHERQYDRVNPAPHVAQGIDSIVCRKNDFALKFYMAWARFRHKQSRDMLSAYKDVTNVLAAATANKDVVVESRLNGNIYRVKVNPILWLDYDESYRCFVSISPFVEGEHVTGIGSQINTQVSRWEREVGVTGLRVLGFNMKFPVNNPDTIVITDLCSNIANLTRK